MFQRIIFKGVDTLELMFRIEGYTVAESDERCCGACEHMMYEDTDGFGYCPEIKTTTRCCNVCPMFKASPEMEDTDSFREAE